MISTHSLSSARSLAPAAYRRWVLGGTALAVLGYLVVTLLEIREVGVLGALTGRNGMLTLVCVIAFVIAARVNEVAGCSLALFASWIEIETAFIGSADFPSGALLILPVLVLAAGLLLGARLALWLGIATIFTTILTCSTAPQLQTGFTTVSLYWLAMHTIAVIAVWTLLALCLSAFGRVFDAMKAHEHDLADTIRFAPDGILVATRGGTVVLANAMAETILRRGQPDIVGRTVQEILTAVCGHPVQLDAMKGDASDTPMELRITSSGSATMHIEVTWRRMERDRDQFLLRDVTPRVHADRRRRDMELQLAHAQRMDAVGRLAGGLSHDFNNILTAVSGSAEMLRVEKNAVERSQLLDEIIAARDRGAALTRQLLSFARREVTQPRVIDLSDHVRGLERLLQRVAGDRNRLRLELAPECRVRVDPGQLEQALVNLVSNARDAMPDGGHCRIIVERVAGPAAMARVQLHVIDNGAGMSHEIAQRAFEPFFTTKPRGQGTGLGLASVHGMAEQSDGTARISSRAGDGTRVTIDLPWIDEPTTRVTPTVITPTQRSGPQSILVAEDDNGTRRVVERILRHAGYVVQTAPDGNSAMAMVDDLSLSFDLVLSDVMMPGHTGPEIADRMQLVRPGTPVLLMTGYAEEQLSELMAHRAGREIITKPFSADALLVRIAGLLQAAGSPLPR